MHKYHPFRNLLLEVYHEVKSVCQNNYRALQDNNTHLQSNSSIIKAERSPLGLSWSTRQEVEQMQHASIDFASDIACVAIAMNMNHRLRHY